MGRKRGLTVDIGPAEVTRRPYTEEEAGTVKRSKYRGADNEGYYTTAQKKKRKGKYRSKLEDDGY